MSGRKASISIFFFVGLCCAHATTACAQGAPGSDQNSDTDRNQPYTLASINGEFALVGTYGSNVGRQLGIVQIHDGQVSGYANANIPGASATERVVVHFSFTGTAAINDDGTGLISVSVTLPNGSIAEFHLDILITKTIELHRRKIAIEMQDMQREVSQIATGEFVVHTLTRRPD